MKKQYRMVVGPKPKCPECKSYMTEIHNDKEWCESAVVGEKGEMMGCYNPEKPSRYECDNCGAEFVKETVYQQK